jgi:hypothetical protein
MAFDDETISRRANYGLELVDALTQQALVGASRVIAERASTPGAPVSGMSFLVNRSRWVFEGLDGEAVFQIDADHYLPATVTTGAGFPSVPLTGAGVLVTVPLRPRSGYPFPPGLTRVIGSVVFDGEPVEGAQVDVFPIFSLSPLVEASVPVTFFTADDGQYVAWFLPDASQDPPTAVAFRANASADIDGTPRLGSIGATPLRLQTVNTVPRIELA